MSQVVFCDDLWMTKKDGYDFFETFESDLGRWRAFESIVEVLEARKTVLFHWEDHFKRMAAACSRFIDLKRLPSESDILAKLRELLEKNGDHSSVIHILVTPGGSQDLKESLGLPTMTLDVRRLDPDHTLPLYLKIVPERRNFPEHKLVAGYGMINRIRKKYDINIANGYDSFLYSDDKGGILEAPFENFFVITKDHKLVTPKYGMLLGVTRGILLDLARQSNLFAGVFEEQIPANHLNFVEEAFLSSTTKGAAPIASINKKKFSYGDDTLTSKLKKEFLEYREKYYQERGV